MTKMIRVLVYKPGVRGEERMVGNELADLQAIVGGYIETVRVSPALPLLAVVNEEGRLRGLPPNRASLVGDFFITRTKGSHFASLTDSDIEEARALFDSAGRR